MKIKWKPIETAPKDETEVLLKCDNWMFIGYWQGEAVTTSPRWMATALDKYGDCGCCTQNCKPDPSHWIDIDFLKELDEEMEELE